MEADARCNCNQMLMDAWNNNVAPVCDKVSYVVGCVSQGGERQKQFLALTRTAVGVASVALSPTAAVAGGLAGVVAPNKVKVCSEWIDAGLTGLWNKMSMRSKVGASLGGIALLGFGVNISVLTLPAAFFAMRLGADLGVINYNKEQS